MTSSQSDPVIHYGKPAEAERPLGRSISRGLLGRCPNCGTGKLFGAYLKPVARCAVCDEDLSPQRSDDLPPYLVILVLGHIVVGGYMIMASIVHLPVWAHLAIWVPVTIIAALAIIQPIKGGVIGLQWALRMHGFGGEDDRPQNFDQGSGPA